MHPEQLAEGTCGATSLVTKRPRLSQLCLYCSQRTLKLRANQALSLGHNLEISKVRPGEDRLMSSSPGTSSGEQDRNLCPPFSRRACFSFPSHLTAAGEAFQGGTVLRRRKDGAGVHRPRGCGDLCGHCCLIQEETFTNDVGAISWVLPAVGVLKECS